MGTHALIMATDAPPLGHPAGGLGRARAALMHTVAARRGVWLAASDRPLAHDGSWLKPVEVDAHTLAAHRDGYCHTSLAPVYFGHTALPRQEEAWLQAHRAVSASYARVAARLAAPGATVWLHDYHLQLVPSLLRRLRPDVRIGLSLHSPFPPAESFLALAARDDILRSLLAADVVGFQDPRSEANFVNLAAPQRPITTLTLPMPADTGPIAHLATDRRVQAAAARIRLALRPAGVIFLGTGGDDPADGSVQQLREFARLLAAGLLDPERSAFIHLAPARPGDTEQRAEIERLVAQINGEHGRPGFCPVHYQRQDLPAADLTALYLAADVMVATPMRDRPTPHAAEYCAARLDGRGRIVLSEFSSGTGQLPHAHVVNPHEPEALGRAMLEAAADAGRPSAAMALMRRQILTDGVSQWAQQFLARLAPVHDPLEGLWHRAHASDTGNRLTATAPHP